MSREIKFRAWDTIDKEWKYSGYPRMPLSSFFDMVENGIYVNDTEYTGLKDKNGKGVYEGDIVKLETSETMRFLGEVRWNNEKAGFQILETTGVWSFIYEKWEVVGNIYENPELLKK